MENNTIKKILDFLEKDENKIPKKKGTLRWKLLFNEPITKNDLNVKDDLNLSNRDITSLPEGLKVGGNLYLIDCTSLKSLPEGLKVGRWLNLANCTSLTSLPEGLQVDSILFLNNCTSLTSLPEGLKVGGDLCIYHTPLIKLSDETLRNMVGDEGYIKGRIFR